MVKSFYTYDYRLKMRHDAVAYFENENDAALLYHTLIKLGFKATMKTKEGKTHTYEVSIKAKRTTK